MGNDWSINQHHGGNSLLSRSGCKLDAFDCNVDMDRQIEIIDNLLATDPPDAMIVHSINDELVAPSIDKAWDAGVPSFCIDFGAATDNLVSFVEHWMDGPAGSVVLGELFVEIAERENKEIHIYEVRSNDAVASFRARYKGFHSAVDQCPLITVTLSPECFYDEEAAASFVIDAFTADPEMNGLFVQGGGAAGSIEGLRAIGRLVQPDDPNHVMVFTNDCDKVVVQAMDDGFVTAVGTHFSYDLVDVVIKQMFTYAILGQPVASHVWVPMKAVTPDTIDTKEGLILGAPIGPRMPREQWDYWPVLDTTEGVFDLSNNPVPLPTPTVELRKQYQGY
jgi:ABC-type sugar transport system substrate-binding protein